MLSDVILKGDCIQELAKIPSESVDLIFADPPYNLQLKSDLRRPDASLVDAVTDDWDKYESFAAYDEFTRQWLTECRRVLKPNGAIWVIGSYHNIFRVGKELQDLGYWILNDILWIKTNPMPNFLGTRFNNSHETLIWAGKSEKTKPTFHYQTMKAHNEDKQMRSDWHISICSGSERVKVNGEKAHSTQKPLALLRRVILATTNAGDLVLDPFLGSGTTAVAARELGRKYIGIEREEKYIKVANERIRNTVPLSADLYNLPLEVKPPKVPFGNLVEMGFIPVGSKLLNGRGDIEALVLAGGILQVGTSTGSIHKIGALVQNQTACNGWDYWHLNNEPISKIRTKFIGEQLDLV